VFLVSPHLETFLARPLAAHRDTARIVAVGTAPGVEAVPARRGGIWDNHDHDHGHAHAPRAPGLNMDWHIWLSPANARAITAHVAHVMAETDPANAPRYAANAASMTARIDMLEAELRDRLAPVRALRYIVFHDAYRYFEDAFGLSPAGAVTISPDRQPGIQRVRTIRQLVREADARCVFAEPQFEPALVQTIIEGTGARAGILDPLGAAVQPGPDAWFAVMRGLADSLIGCPGAAD
jgi:zinc transport system substrate-binding protein